MKKLLIVGLMLILVFSVVACGGENKEQGGKEENLKAEIIDKEEVKKEDLKEVTLGLVTDTGGIDDKSFNQGTWEGLKYYQEKFELPEKNVSFLQSTSDADYIPNLTRYSEDKADLIVAPGFLFEKALTQIAKDFPDQKILFIDAVVDAPNIASAVFAEHQGSYLVGLAAGLKAKAEGKDTVGFVGGMDFETIQKFEAGYEQGVKAIDPNMNVLIEYVGSFDKTEDAQTIAAKMYDQGAYVIYHAAGSAGNGVIKEAKDRAQNGEDVWVIGVDRDQYLEGKYGDGDKSVILTSMVKRVDQVAYDMAKMVAMDKFKGGLYVYELKDNGVLLPPQNPNLTDEWLKTIDEYKEKIIKGEIEVSPTPQRLQ